MRPGAAVLAAALFLGAAAPLHADEWALSTSRPASPTTLERPSSRRTTSSSRPPAATRSTPSASAPTRRSASPRSHGWTGQRAAPAQGGRNGQRAGRYRFSATWPRHFSIPPLGEREPSVTAPSRAGRRGDAGVGDRGRARPRASDELGLAWRGANRHVVAADHDRALGMSPAPWVGPTVGRLAHGLRRRRGRRRRGGRRRARRGGWRHRARRGPIVSREEQVTGIWLVAGLAMVFASTRCSRWVSRRGCSTCAPARVSAANGRRWLLPVIAATTVLIVLDLALGIGGASSPRWVYLTNRAGSFERVVDDRAAAPPPLPPGGIARRSGGAGRGPGRAPGAERHAADLRRVQADPALGRRLAVARGLHPGALRGLFSHALCPSCLHSLYPEPPRAEARPPIFTRKSSNVPSVSQLAAPRG